MYAEHVETRWKGESTRFIGAAGNRYKLWWREFDGNAGVGALVEEELVFTVEGII